MKPQRKKKGRGTHYAYMGGGEVMRKVSTVFDMSKARIETRRRVIHELIERGECLAALPHGFEVNCDLDALERFLEGDL